MMMDTQNSDHHAFTDPSTVDSSYIIKNKASQSEPGQRYIEAIQRMERAGFRLETTGEKLRVYPSDKLTAAQRDWLKQHKAEIMAALNTRMDANIREIITLFNATMAVERFDAHPTNTVFTLVQCGDCRHGQRSLPSDEPGSYRICKAGNGARFALQHHHCEHHETLHERLCT
jgi:hypothetical protein